MTNEQYDRSIETGELQLSDSEKLSHFGIVIFCFFVTVTLPSLHLFFYLKGEQTSFKSGELLIIFISALVGCLFYWLQKKRLRFKVLQTTLTKAELLKIIKNVEERLNWVPPSYRGKIILAKTDPDLLSGSWGERVTILFYNDQVFINSICDPGKRPSVVSFGRNRENVNSLVEAISKVEHDHIS